MNDITYCSNKRCPLQINCKRCYAQLPLDTQKIVSVSNFVWDWSNLDEICEFYKPITKEKPQ